jgi:predicted glycosyltransferase
MYATNVDIKVYATPNVNECHTKYLVVTEHLLRITYNGYMRSHSGYIAKKRNAQTIIIFSKKRYN